MDQQNDVGGGLPPTAHTHTHFAIFLGRKEHGRFGEYGETDYYSICGAKNTTNEKCLWLGLGLVSVLHSICIDLY